MAKKIDVLTQLKNMRSKNLVTMSEWSIEDFQEMLATYQQAKAIALEANEGESIAILDEKLSQVNEAYSLKGLTPSKQIDA